MERNYNILIFPVHILRTLRFIRQFNDIGIVQCAEIAASSRHETRGRTPKSGRSDKKYYLKNMGAAPGNCVNHIIVKKINE
jgi:hypothetical protein